MTGALRFEGRVRVLPRGGTRAASGDAVVVRGADSVTLLIAAATSYRRFDDVGGDPAAAVAAALDRAAVKSVEALRDAHVRDYRQLFDRVTLDLGPTSRAAMPVDQRVAAFANGRRSGAGGTLLPVRALPAHRQLAARVAAGQPAGDLERQPLAAVGQQVHDQHQHPDELLAGALHESRGDDGSAHGAGPGSGCHRRANGARDVRRRRLGRASQHRSLAGDGADRRAAVGPVANRWRLAVASCSSSATSTTATAPTCGRSIRCSKDRRSSSSIRWSTIRRASGW